MVCALPAALLGLAKVTNKDAGRLFDFIDADRNGSLDLKELQKHLSGGQKKKVKAKALKSAEAPPPPPPPPRALDLHSAIEKLRVEVTRNWSRVKDHLIKWDTDKSGEVDREEWSKCLLEALEMEVTKEDCGLLFDFFDENKSGSLDIGELTKHLGSKSKTSAEDVSDWEAAERAKLALQQKEEEESRIRGGRGSVDGSARLLSSVIESSARLRLKASPPRPDMHRETYSSRLRRGEPPPPKKEMPPATGTLQWMHRGELSQHSHRQHLELWTRREATDRLHSSGRLTLDKHKDPSKFLRELAADPTGFAFGGVYPGTLHAHGKIFDSHRVSYSIGRAGTYRLHVNLHREQTPLPGSPFKLQVLPGLEASASTSFITYSAGADSPSRLARGKSGRRSDAGCTMMLRSCDEMGNFCINGGSKVTCMSPLAPQLTVECTDLGNGSYQIEWRAPARTEACSYDVEVSMGGVPVMGSPVRVVMEERRTTLARLSLIIGGWA